MEEDDRPRPRGDAASKITAMEAAGIHVVKSPAEMGATMARLLGKS